MKNPNTIEQLLQELENQKNYSAELEKKVRSLWRDNIAIIRQSDKSARNSKIYLWVVSALYFAVLVFLHYSSCN